MDDVLDSAEKYYEEVLKPQQDEFLGASPTFRAGISLASSLFHFHEWLHKYRRLDLERVLGKHLDKPADLWREVEAADKARFGYVRDVANASKHVSLDRHPSTPMTHAADVARHGGVYSRGFSRGFDVTRLTINAGDAQIDFEECTTALFNYWTRLLHRLSAIGGPRQPGE
jgi:hypothetical protein